MNQKYCLTFTSMKIFITGATGYMGEALIPILLERGHQVTAFVRPGSEKKVPNGVRVVTGDPLNADSLKNGLGQCDTWVQLIGTPHPAPWKGKLFRLVDLPAVIASAEALPHSSIRHFIYLSVAHPAPIMRAFIAVRQEGETRIAKTGVAATFLRPWYVLGPGHYWAYALLPFYKLLEKIPVTRDAALRLGLVSREQMIQSLVWAIENPAIGIREMNVPEIRSATPAQR